MPQTDRPLFTADDVTNLLRETVTVDQAAVAERMVWGWLKPAWQLAERPQTLDDEQYAAAVELGAIAVTNPGGLAEYQLGGERQRFSLERRVEILAAAGPSGDGSTSSTSAPVGRFHPAPPYPDPAW